MGFKNTTNNYGSIAKWLHCGGVSALAFLRKKGAKSAFSNLQAVYRIGLVVPKRGKKVLTLRAVEAEPPLS